MSSCLEKIKKILIIEDEESHIQLIKRSLEGLRFPVELKTAEFKKDVQEALSEFKPDLIICDYYLPETTGLSILRNVRKDNPVLPFILISGYVGEEKAADIILEGANDFILKGNYNRLQLSVERELQNYRKEIERAFREKREQSLIRTTFKMAGIGYCECDLNSDSWSLSDSAVKILGFDTAGSVSTESILESILSEYDKASFSSVLREHRHAVQESTVDVEFSILHNKQGYRKLNLIGEIIRCPNNTPQFTGCIKDVTQLQSRRQQFASLADSLPGVIQRYKLNPDFTEEIIYVSDKVTAITGLTPAQIKENPELYWGRVHPDYTDIVRNSMIESFNELSIWNVHYKALDRDDNVMWIEGRGIPVKQPDGSVIWDTIMLDITDKKEAESELLAQKDKFETLIRDGSDPVAVLDPQGRFKEYILMTRVRDKYGIDEKHYIGKTPDLFIHREDRQRVLKEFFALKEGESKIIGPFRFLYPDRKWHWVESTVVNLCHREEIQGYVTTNRDVTERIGQEDQIRQLSEVAARTHDIILITDRNHKLKWVNKAFENISELTSRDILGKPVFELMKILRVPADAFRTIGSLINNKVPFTEKVNITTPSGESKWLSISADPVTNGDSFEGFIGITHDITQVIQKEHKLQGALKEKQYLLSEIHHRVKNNLAVVSGLLQLQAFEENDPEIQKVLSKSIGRIQSMAGVHELLYKSDDFAQVEIGEEFEAGIQRMVSRISSNRQNVLESEIEPAKLNINQAVPFAMLTNELIELISDCLHRESGDVKLKLEFRSGDNNAHQLSLYEYLGEKENADHIRACFDEIIEKDIVRVLGQQLEGHLETVHFEYHAGIKLTFRSRNIKGSSSAIEVK